MGSRRQIARQAARALNPEAEVLDLPKGAPYGAVLVDKDACTEWESDGTACACVSAGACTHTGGVSEACEASDQSLCAAWTSDAGCATPNQHVGSLSATDAALRSAFAPRPRTLPII